MKYKRKPGETMEDAAQRTMKQTRTRKKLLARGLMAAWILLLLFLAYIAIQVVIVLNPNIRTEVALLDSMTDSITVQGFVALKSESVTSGGGVLYYTVPSGERVSQGTEIAEVYGSEAAAEARSRLDELDSEIALVESAAGTASYSGDTEAYARQVNTSIVGLLDALDTRNYSDLQNATGDVALSNNKLLMATGESSGLDNLLASLQSQRNSYAAAAVSQGSVLAPESGYFVIASGNERVPLDYETLKAATPQQLADRGSQQPQYYGDNVVGYIISDYKWNFFATVTAEQAERFVVGDDSLNLTFSETGSTQLPVEVYDVVVDEAAGIAKIELYCEYMSPEILKMQSQTVDIVFETYKGLRVSKDALRIGERMDEDGEMHYPRGVYILQLGSAYFKEIEILVEDEYYMLIAPQSRSSNSQVSQYDEIIVDSGGVALDDGKTIQ